MFYSDVANVLLGANEQVAEERNTIPPSEKVNEDEHECILCDFKRNWDIGLTELRKVLRCSASKI